MVILWVWCFYNYHARKSISIKRLSPFACQSEKPINSKKVKVNYRYTATTFFGKIQSIMEILYKKITEADIQDVVKIHKTIFPDYFLTSLGDNLLFRYYKAFLEENPSLFLGAYVNGVLTGISLGYLVDKTKAKEVFEQENKKALSKRLFLLCLRLDPKAISRCFRYVFSSHKKETKRQTNLGSYLVMGVIPDYRGYNIASTLTYFLLKQFQAIGIEQVETAVNKKNNHTNDFWMKKGATYSRTEEGHKYYILPVTKMIDEYESKHGKPLLS